MKIAVYPGSFDPFTNGHLDIVDRACEIFDKVIVAVAVNSAKKGGLFTLEERQDLLRQVLGSREQVEVAFFDGLLVDYVDEVGAHAIIRGIRAVTDFDYEYAIYQVNRELNGRVETVFLLASKEYSYLSSTILKEVARYGRSVADYAPAVVGEALLKKFGHAP